MATFTNAHLSYSRLSRFEACPASFKFHYIDKLPSEPGMPLRFGKVVHAALEVLYRKVVEEEHTGALDEDRTLALFADAWAADGLTGLHEFGEGVAMLRAFVRNQGAVDHRDVLAVEKEFRLPVGGFTVLGFIDRVDRIDDETIEVVDYKTNRQIFTREEVGTSLQLSLYELAVRRLWPWAKKVRLTFAMLRHGIRQTTTRTPEQLEAALAYVDTLGRMTEQATDFPARVSGNCVHCDHRAQCSAYTEALRGKRTILGADPDDLDAVAREREEVSKLAKIFYARKSELEGVLRQHLRDRDDLVLAGMRYSLVPTTAGISYPTGRTLRVLEDRTGLPRDELLERVATIDRDALDALVSETVKTADKARATLLRAEVNALADHFTVPVWAPTNGLSPPCAAQRPRIDRWVTEHQGRHECACGCGTQISIVARHHCVGIPRYAPNHSPRPKLGLGPAHPRYISDRTLAVRPRAFPAYVKRAVMVEFQGRCAWCGTADSLECDHIIPASLGGEATLANAQLLCANCHRWKTAIEPTSRSGKTPETRSRKRREGVPHAGDR